MDYFTKKVLLNHQLFIEKLLANPDFFREILDWQERLMLTDQKLGNFFDTKKEIYIEARKYGIRLMEQIMKEENIDFMNWLNEFAEKYNLSKDWEQRIIDLIACGYYCPPETSIDITLNKDANVVFLEIRPGATKEDFEKAWTMTREKLKELPAKNSRKFSQKSFRNIEKILLANKLRSDEKLKGLDLIGRIYENEEDITEKADKRRKNTLKIAQQRLKKRGYAK
jgi:hypothetical protein